MVFILDLVFYLSLSINLGYARTNYLLVEVYGTSVGNHLNTLCSLYLTFFKYNVMNKYSVTFVKYFLFCTRKHRFYVSSYEYQGNH